MIIFSSQKNRRTLRRFLISLITILFLSLSVIIIANKHPYGKANFVNAKDAPKTAYLTFDDGPCSKTGKILDVLKEKNVKATFFVIAKPEEYYDQFYHRIADEGHLIGMHSYSHIYKDIYRSPDVYFNDLHKLRDFLDEKVDVRPNVFRFPGGSSNSMAKKYGGKSIIPDIISRCPSEELVYFDWNVSSEDASGTDKSVSYIVNKVMKEALKYNEPVILMHDIYKCNTTVQALPIIIDKLTQKGYTFSTVDKMIVPVQHVKLESTRPKDI